MPIIYHIAIKFYLFLIWIASFFHKKAKNWIDGRKNWRQKYHPDLNIKKIWFHFASLGEFEQGKPLLKEVRERFPEKKIIITFFSPSGYEIRKNSPFGDYILYLPLDTANNAEDFIDIFKPELAIFNKYEYWYHFFKSLNENKIPLYITSAIFRSDQIFFKWYGGFNRRILKYVTHFFVQDEASEKALHTIGFSNTTISGDTRFDSVLELSKNRKDFPLIAAFKGNQHLFIAGSTWSEDENIIIEFIKQAPEDWRFIFAPHEITENRIAELEKSSDGSIRYSQLINEPSKAGSAKILIIDNIGMLSSLYAYGNISYIGGGFGAGIHNTLEAAAWGSPVIFGPKYHKFKEARDLIHLGAGFSISNQNQFNVITTALMVNKNYRQLCGGQAKKYVQENTGATEIIMKKLF